MRFKEDIKNKSPFELTEKEFAFIIGYASGLCWSKDMVCDTIWERLEYFLGLQASDFYVSYPSGIFKYKGQKLYRIEYSHEGRNQWGIYQIFTYGNDNLKSSYYGWDICNIQEEFEFEFDDISSLGEGLKIKIMDDDYDGKPYSEGIPTSIIYWYDRYTRNWIAQVLDEKGCEIENQYAGTRDDIILYCKDFSEIYNLPYKRFKETLAKINYKHLNSKNLGILVENNKMYWEENKKAKNQLFLKEKVSSQDYAPSKTGKAYKVFKVKDGKLYPPMVANKGGADTPVGVWLDAEEGEFAGLSKTGRPQVKRSNKAGVLAYRPGWHLGDIPRAKQFDRLNKETGEYEFPKDFVWAECEYVMDIDYQNEADEQGYMRTKVDDSGNVTNYKSDKYQHSLAGLKKLPTNGYYKYRTNPDPDTVPWVITGQMKVDRLLSDDEVNEILKSKGIEPIHRQGGDKTLQELGL